MHNFRYLLVIFLINNVRAFNFDTNFPIVYTDPYSFNGYQLQKDSYFGYSVLLFEGSNMSAPWIQIGAPRGPNPFTHGNETTGVLFRCGIKSTCGHIKTDTTDSDGIADEAYFGNSMDISPNNDIYAVCGHRWMYKTSTDYFIQGACFAGRTDENDTAFVRPLKMKDKQIVDLGPGLRVYNKALAQIGFSAQFSKSGNGLIVGLPGLLNWKGMAGLLSSYEAPNPARRITRRAVPNVFDENQIPDARAVEDIKYFDLAGYSVTSGRFYYDEKMYYVTGAPRASLKGSVLIFQLNNNPDTTGFTLKDRKDGSYVGEYFGSSVTASDINGDGLDDLIVGAPFHKNLGSDFKYDEGAIYIYLGSKDKLIEASTNLIEGKSSGGRFGESVMSLGDIDKDGCNDIAVAAPYESDNSGVVYIFRGDKRTGLIKEPSQIISGKKIIPNVRGFGISLSRPADIDGNNYNDFAIGAYKSGHAVLLRGKPVVILDHTLTSSIHQINAKDKAVSFSITSCVAFRGDSIMPPIRAVRSLTVDKDVPGRAYVEDRSNLMSELQVPNQNYCESYTVKISDTNKNIYDPIVIKVSVNLVKRNESSAIITVTNTVEGDDQFCKTCPILRNPEETARQVNIDYNRGCRNDRVCNSQLFLSAKFLNLDNSVYIIGSKNYISMQATVTNMDENAFQTEIQITLPNPVRLRSIPSYCKEGVSEISCTIDNPLATNTSKTVSLELDLDEVNTGKYQDVLDFLLKVSTSSENYGDKDKKLSLKLVKNADVEIIGSSSEETYSYINRTYGKASFQQIYKVIKYDISPIQKVHLHISVPTKIYTGSSDLQFLSIYSPAGTLAGQSITCTSDIAFKMDSNVDVIEGEMEKKKRRRRDVATVEEQLSKYPSNRTIYMNCTTDGVTCGNIWCDLGPFKNTKHIAELKLKMDLDISELVGYMTEKDIIIVSSNAEIKIVDAVNNNNTYSHAVTVPSVFIGPSAELSVATWIIIVAIICGILLLLIVAGILYKLGFFKRTKKELLINEMAKKNAEDQTEPLHEDNEP